MRARAWKPPARSSSRKRRLQLGQNRHGPKRSVGTGNRSQPLTRSEKEVVKRAGRVWMRDWCAVLAAAWRQLRAFNWGRIGTHR